MDESPGLSGVREVEMERTTSQSSWGALSGRSRRVVLGLALCAYPALVMARVLSPQGHSHLRDPTAPKNLLTDLDGAVWVTRILDHLPVPWAMSKMIGYPDGESLVRWQFFAQAMQWAALFLLTRVFPPVLSLNLFVLIGWIASGVAAYALARRLSLSCWASVGAAVLVQMLPAMPKMASNYTSYVFICVPIYVVCRAIDLGTDPCRRNVVWLVGALGFTALFDAYWFYFSIAATALVLLCNARTLVAWLRLGPRWARLLAVLTLTIAIAFPVWLVASFGLASGSNASRPVSVENRAFVDAGLRMPWHWLRSSVEGVGVVIGGVGIATIVWLLARRRDAAATSAAAVALLMMLLSTRTGLDTRWFRIGSLAEYARFVMPGVRFFQRAALIAEALICILAVRGAVSMWPAFVKRTPSSDRTRRAVATGAVVLAASVVLVEYAPFDRPVSSRWDDFAGFRAVLAEVDRPVVLAVPFERHGRAWLEFSMLDEAHAVNQLYSREREDRTAVAASRGPAAFAAYLRALGTTHLLSIEGENRYPVTYEFSEPWFVERSSLLLDSYGDAEEVVTLFEVRASPAPSPPCDESCRVGTGFDFVDGINVLREPDVPREQGLRDEVVVAGDGWGMLDDSIEMQVSLRRLATMTYVARFGLEVVNPCDDERTVTLVRSGFEQRVTLGPAESALLSVDIESDRATDPLVVSTDGPACGGLDGEPITLVVGRPFVEPPA